MFVTVPGIFGSGPDHWQTIWEGAEEGFVRFSPASWDAPQLSNWMSALAVAARRAGPESLLVAHSLGCLLVAHWAASPLYVPVAGAFLVSVPDPGSESFPSEAIDFSDAPASPLSFPSLMLASTNDPFATLGYAQDRAQAWGSALVTVGPLGHINGDSKLGEWQQGRALLEAFAAGARRPR